MNSQRPAPVFWVLELKMCTTSPGLTILKKHFLTSSYLGKSSHQKPQMEKFTPMMSHAYSVLDLTGQLRVQVKSQNLKTKNKQTKLKTEKPKPPNLWGLGLAQVSGMRSRCLICILTCWQVSLWCHRHKSLETGPEEWVPANGSCCSVVTINTCARDKPDSPGNLARRPGYTEGVQWEG